MPLLESYFWQTKIFLKIFTMNGCKKVWKMKKKINQQGKFHEISGWSNMTSH